ncbi:hypothetical protein SAMN05443144_11930 [Fodinibius roseus]|uniref:Uncharacterized protein n=1 Tax=Fodinibius roseus TaxID=1194090 RepID=A0A1M5H3R7_9BACT|nr:hypothetical protein [Fodinibius roseus]SHG10681.1 hypothetical protein SAMN05443144_11930 [Fodinibius roseus]
MKQQITAIIEKVTIDKTTLELVEPADIALEFSAIDTGGGFRDPILDFAYELVLVNATMTEETTHHIVLDIREPDDRKNRLSIAYDGILKQKSGEPLAGIGRLQDGKVTPEVVKFIMRCLR